MIRVKTKPKSKYKSVAIPLGLWERISKVVKRTGIYNNEAEFIREAIREKLEEIEVVEPVDLSDEEIYERVLSFLKDRGRAYPSDICIELGIPYFKVLEVLEKLVEERIVEPEV